MKPQLATFRFHEGQMKHGAANVGILEACGPTVGRPALLKISIRRGGKVVCVANNYRVMLIVTMNPADQFPVAVPHYSLN
jgi:hypothetical protein